MGDVRLLNGITPQGWEPLQFQLSFAHTRSIRCGLDRTLPGVAAGTALLLAVMSGSAIAQTRDGRFSRTMDVMGAVDLEVMTGAGSIEVRTGQSGVVSVEGRIRASESSRYTAGTRRPPRCPAAASTPVTSHRTTGRHPVATRSVSRRIEPVRPA